METIQDWLEVMNGSLLELARVSKPGARAVIDLREIKVGKEKVALDELLREDVQENLSRFWDNEAVFINRPRSAVLKDKERDRSKDHEVNRVLVLRRR